MDIQLSDAEKVFIINGAEEGVRADGRGLFDYRPIIVETGVLSTTNGSARVRLASTDLLIGVKTELVVVEDFDSYRNRLNFSVDCSANATPLFVGRGGENLAVEVASVLDAAYDNKHVLPDFNRLILSPMHAWKLYVDIVILECGGNVVDAAAIGVKAALRNTEMCDVIVRPADEGKFSIDLASDNTVWKFDVTRAPLLSTVHKLGEANLADASLTEQACSRCALCVAASPIENSEKDESMWSEDQSMVTMIRQSGGGSLEVESLDEMVRMGVRTVLELNRALYKRLSEEDQDIDSDPSMTFML